ncbi:MAG: MBL fold metallo-hydrolase [Anaerolineales bacterium]|nr:MBL fold metallo-hydrolase [Anaerolineales bacterium]
MIRERVAEDVYIFTSETYAQVNAGAVVGPEWAIVIDTLAYPEESQEIREFIEEKLGLPVRYLINTHYHADHSLGNIWFPNAIIVSNELCRDLLNTKGRIALEEAKQQNRELAEVEIVLPDVTFEDGFVGLRTGKRTLRMVPLPGHSIDGLGVLVVEDNVLFSGDIMMPVPYILDGDIDLMNETLKSLAKFKLENLVQGHGEVILRGEVQNAVKNNLNYLAIIRKHAKIALRRKDPDGYLNGIDVESCGKSRILLNGLAEELHRRNLFGLYQKLKDDKKES